MTKQEKEIIFDELDQTTDALYLCEERRIKKIGNSYNADAKANFERYCALRNLLYSLGLVPEYDIHWESVKDNFHPYPFKREPKS
jgi:hypothetical protein